VDDLSKGEIVGGFLLFQDTKEDSSKKKLVVDLLV
jgi:hypothetical protein